MSRFDVFPTKGNEISPKKGSNRKNVRLPNAFFPSLSPQSPHKGKKIDKVGLTNIILICDGGSF
jgi:hypothetical protein